MSETVILSLIVAMPAIIAAIGGILSTMSSWKAEKKLKVADEKLDHITTLTNSTLSAANRRIAALEKVVKRLLKEKRTKKALETDDEGHN